MSKEQQHPKKPHGAPQPAAYGTKQKKTGNGTPLPPPFTTVKVVNKKPGTVVTSGKATNVQAGQVLNAMPMPRSNGQTATNTSGNASGQIVRAETSSNPENNLSAMHDVSASQNLCITDVTVNFDPSGVTATFTVFDTAASASSPVTKPMS